MVIEEKQLDKISNEDNKKTSDKFEEVTHELKDNKINNMEISRDSITEGYQNIRETYEISENNFNDFPLY